IDGPHRVSAQSKCLGHLSHRSVHGQALSGYPGTLDPRDHFEGDPEIPLKSVQFRCLGAFAASLSLKSEGLPDALVVAAFPVVQPRMGNDLNHPPGHHSLDISIGGQVRTLYRLDRSADPHESLQCGEDGDTKVVTVLLPEVPQAC